MGQGQRMVRLGFAGGTFPAGTHICQIFSDDDERNDALMAFLLAGLQDGELATCFSERLDAGALKASLENHGLDLEALQQSGRLTLSGTRDVYFAENRFDPDRMLQRLSDYYDYSLQVGCPARVIGEMTSEVTRVQGGERLMEYECGVSLMLQEKPITAVCQYEAQAFDGATIMDVLRVHPMMVVRGEVLHNPFYVPPAEFLSRQEPRE